MRVSNIPLTPYVRLWVPMKLVGKCHRIGVGRSGRSQEQRTQVASTPTWRGSCERMFVLFI